MKIAVIGLGYWGPNLVRNLLALHQDVHVYDTQESRIRLLLEKHPACTPIQSIDDVWSDRTFEAVALAVPLPAHAGLIVRALEAHKHVFVEKPLCFSLREAEAIEQALNGGVLMVGHITQFSAGIQKIAAALGQNAIGDIRRMSCTRTHFGPVYRGTDVLTEVAAHDVAILAAALPAAPQTVQAWGIERLRNENPDSAHIVLRWPDECLAVIDVQWSSVLRRREIEIEGTDGTIFFRAQQSPEELTIYHHKNAYDCLSQGAPCEHARPLVEKRQISIDPQEALYEELSHFLECIRLKKKPITDYRFSRRVVRILEAARQSMNSGGSIVTLQ